MADDVTVTFGAQIDRLTAAVNDVKSQLGSIESAATSVGNTFLKVGALIGVAFSLGGLNEFARKMAESGLEAERTAAVLGITAWQVGQLSSLAKLSGTSLDAMVLSIERLALNAQHAARDGLGPQAQAFKVLGTNAKDFIGLKGDEFFLKLADAVGKFNPSLNLTTALMQAGGRGVQQLIPLLLQGSEGMKRFQEAAAQTKIGTMGFAEAAAESHIKLTLFDMAVSGLQKQLFLQLKPALDAVTDQTRKFVMEIRNSIADGGAWFYVVQSLAEILKGLALAGAGVAFMFRFLSAEAKAFWNNTGTNADEVKAQLVKDLDDMSKKFKETFDGMYGPKPKTHVDVGGKQDAGAIADAKNQIEIMKSMIDQKATIEQTGYERSKILLEADVATFKMFQIDKLRAEQDLNYQIYSIQYNAQTQKMQLYAQGTKEYEQEQKKLVEISQRYQLQIAQQQVAITKELAAKWGEAFGAISGAVTGQLRGLLEKTTTWSQAITNIFEDLLLKFIDVVAQMGVKWAAGQMAQMMATQSAGEAALPIKIARFESDLAAAAALAAANAYASLAAFPPAALAAAAAAVGAIEGLGQAGIPKFAAGSPFISRDGPAVLHKGEMVIPADFSEAIRQGTASLGGGGGQTSVSIQAWDGASVASWLRGGGARSIARALSDHWQTSPTDRPQY